MSPGRNMPEDNPQCCRFLLVAGFVVTAWAGLFYNLGGYRTFVWHEARAAVPAREMMSSGDWLIPRFAGVPRLAKPPLVYWMLATLGTIAGGLNELLARLPQAIAAVLLAVLIGVWGKRWYGETAGWAAAFAQLTSVYVLVYGRKAEVDMTLWLLMTAAMYLVATQPEAESGRRRFLRWTIFYAALAVCWLGKFHYGPVMVLGPVVVLSLLQRQPRQLWNLLNPAGLLLLAAAILVWPWLAQQQMPGVWDVWQRETVGRAAGRLGSDPFWYYLPVIGAYALPWSVVALSALPASWRLAWKEGDARERFLWVWFAVQLLIVSLQPDKHSHYIFAALPVVSLWAGRQLAGWMKMAKTGRRRLAWQWAIVIVLAVSASCGIAFPVIQRRFAAIWPAISAAVLFGLCCVLIAAAATAVAFMVGRIRWAGVANAAAFLGIMMSLHGIVLPAYDPRAEQVRFAREVRRQLGPEQTVSLHGLGEDPVAWYVNLPVRRVPATDAISADGKTVYAVFQERDLNRLRGPTAYRVLRRQPVEKQGGSLVLVEVEIPAAIAAGRTDGEHH